MKSLCRPNFTNAVSTCYRNDNLIPHLKGLPSTVRHLQVANNRLSSLASFAHLKDLQTLDISENSLDSLGSK